MRQAGSGGGGFRVVSHSRRKRILDALWSGERPNSRNVWVILDGARHPAIYPAVSYTHSDKCCLYSGDLPRELAQAAPYLVQVYKDDGFTDRIINRGWGDNWGVYFRCDTTLEETRRHLRRFLRVQDERGRRLVFRYYDPRVLRRYLPTCWPRELETVFGPIEHFMVEGEKADTLIRFGLAGAKLTQEVFHVGLRDSQVVPEPNESRHARSRQTDAHSRIERQLPALTIRDRQLDVFSEYAQGDFKRRLRGYLNDRLRAAGIELSGDALSAQIDLGLESAGSFGITRECDVARYIEIAATRLGGFTDQPPPKAVLNILLAYRVEPAEKLTRLERLLAANEIPLVFAEGRLNA